MSHKKIAIITGVSRLKGIGRAICLELAKREIDIFFTYWTNYDLEMSWGVGKNEPDFIQQEILDLGVKCEKMELDLSQENSINLLLDHVQAKLGNPSILINNATYSTSTSLDDITPTELDKHYKVNVKGTLFLTTEFIKRFAFSDGGRIVNLTSGQSQGPMPNEIAYAITKAAMETFVQTIAQEIAAKGITINAVNPGPVDTGWMDEALEKELLSRFPMKRIGLPSDPARLIGFLTSEAGEWITGQIIHSEGGFMR